MEFIGIPLPLGLNPICITGTPIATPSRTALRSSTFTHTYILGALTIRVSMIMPSMCIPIESRSIIIPRQGIPRTRPFPNLAVQSGPQKAGSGA